MLRRLGPALPLLVFAVAFALGAAILSNVSSCSVKDAVSDQPRTFQGVPEIRVLLTPTGLRSASISTSGPYELTLDGRTVLAAAAPLAPTEVACAAGRWHVNALDLDGRQLLLRPGENSYVRLAGQPFRGALRLLPAGDDGVYVVNTLDLEGYLAGVLAKELISDWSAETYGALAIAARTFALYNMQNFGVSHDFDLGAGQAWQVYGGRSAETPKSWQAVRATHGIVLGYGPAGAEKIFLAQYSASCGGRVNDASVIRDAPAIEPLQGGQVCEDCQACPRYRWNAVRLPCRDVAAAIAQAYPDEPPLQAIKEIRVGSQTPYGRAVWLDVVGPPRTIRLRAEDLRLALLRAGLPQAKQIYSMNCGIRVVGDQVEFHDGRGFGHGVGLCQWGAEGKARKGSSAQQILNFYYPAAQLFSAY